MRLSKWLEKTGTGTTEFARRIDTTDEAVRRYCQGRRMPEPEIAQRIVDATNGQVTVQDLHEARLEFLREVA